MQKHITKKIIILLMLAIFVGGYASLSLELIVLRQLSSFVGTTTITVSIVMGTFLAFMSLGYYKGSTEKMACTSLRGQAAKGFFVIAFLTALASTYPLMDMYFRFFNYLGITSNVVQTALYSLIFISYGPYLFGKITAMLSRYLHHDNPNYTGKIMAVDTVGSVCGSLLTTLLIMPFIGVNYTIVVVVFFTLMTAAALSRKRVSDAFIIAGILIFAVLFNQGKILKDVYDIVENNAVSTIGIFNQDDYKSKVLLVNGSWSSKISSEHDLNFGYVNFINDNFVYTLPKDKVHDVLIVGAGGFTIGLQDNRNNYVYVDIDKNLQRITEDNFLEQKLSNNKSFVVQDANQFLKESTQKYDLIVLDTYSSHHYIPMDLVTREYFQRAKNNLKEHGILVLNAITSAAFNDDFAMNLDNTLRVVFPNNLRAQTIQQFNPWIGGERNNIIYVYYHRTNPNKIYSINKNASFYDFEM